MTDHDTDVAFLRDVKAEADAARLRFGKQESKVTGLALAEEFGEVVRALLHILEGKGGEDELRGEAMCMRLANEKESRVLWAGNGGQFDKAEAVASIRARLATLIDGRYDGDAVVNEILIVLRDRGVYIPE
jgi:hypothetical protein